MHRTIQSAFGTSTKRVTLDLLTGYVTDLVIRGRYLSVPTLCFGGQRFTLRNANYGECQTLSEVRISLQYLEADDPLRQIIDVCREESMSDEHCGLNMSKCVDLYLEFDKPVENLELYAITTVHNNDLINLKFTVNE